LILSVEVTIVFFRKTVVTKLQPQNLGLMPTPMLCREQRNQPIALALADCKLGTEAIRAMFGCWDGLD
jgi:hypothetical protein